MTFSELHSQLDLINYRSQANSKYKFVLVYQGHLTKFCTPKLLMSKRAKEVAYCLLDIFTLFVPQAYYKITIVMNSETKL